MECKYTIAIEKNSILDLSVKRSAYLIFSTISLFLLVFEVPIMKISIIHIYAILAMVYLVIKNVLLDKKIIMLVRFYILLTIQFILMILLIDARINTFYDQIIKVVEFIVIAYAFAALNKSFKIKLESIISMLIVVSLIQSIFGLLSFFIPSFRSMTLDFMFSNYEFNNVNLLTHRVYGIGINFMYTLPIFQAFMGIICFKRCYDKKFGYIILSIILAFSAVINARTALVIYIVGCFIVLISGKSLVKGKNYIIKTILMILIAILFLSYIWVNLEVYSPETYRWINEGVEVIRKFFQGELTGFFLDIQGGAKNHELNALQLLFGVGHFIMGDPYLGYSADVGYINYFYLGGLVYSTILYSLYIIILYNIYKSNSENRVYSVLLAITVLIMNYKGQGFGANEIVFLLFIIYFTCENKKEAV